MIDKTLIERSVRETLARLGPHETLSTAELGARISAGMFADDPKMRSLVFKQLDVLGRYARDLCELVPTIAPKGFNSGKTINRRIWHHIDSAAMPERPPSQSAGAASPGTSLADAVAKHEERLQRIEDWITDRDPLFRVL